VEKAVDDLREQEKKEEKSLQALLQNKNVKYDN
jgi:hypothetical protein